MRPVILVCCAALIIGVTGGFYLALFIQNQIELLAGAAIIFAFLNWLGSGTALLELVRDWYKQRRENVKFEIEYQPQDNLFLFQPTLEMVSNTGERLNITRKFLKVGIKNSGGKIARKCKATLQFRGSCP